MSSENAVIVYCEECGKRYEIDCQNLRADQQTFNCRVCNDPITVTRTCPGGTISVQEALLHQQRDESLDSEGPRRLLMVDDSRLIRRVLGDIFDKSDHLEVVGEASNGKEALEQVLDLKPHVITMDINMPVMDGLTALKHVMIEMPTPTVMCSTLTAGGATVTFDALKYGGIDFIHKPSNLDGDALQEQQEAIARKVHLASNVKIENVHYLKAVRQQATDAAQTSQECSAIITLGAAVGGYTTLLKIIPLLPADFPGALMVVLHENPKHIDAFTGYLNSHSEMSVQRVQTGDTVRNGNCYVASGAEYATVSTANGLPKLQVNPNPFPKRKGSVNMLMISVAESMGSKGVGVVLSGNGEDGTEGMREIHRNGGTTIVQNPETCLSPEMPIAAIDGGPVDHVISDGKLANALNMLLMQRRSGLGIEGIYR